MPRRRAFFLPRSRGRRARARWTVGLNSSADGPVLVSKLDHWWESKGGTRRIDRGPMYVCIMISLWASALSMTLIGPVPNSSLSVLDGNVQNMLSVIMWFGTTICLVGLTSGSKIVFPTWKRTKSYRLGIVGIPAVVSSIVFYGYAVMVHTENFPSAIGAILTPMIGLGTLINGLYLWLEVRRINKNVEAVKAIENG